MHPSLKFTNETEQNMKLPFLDVLVEKTQAGLITSVYRKPTFSGLYTRFNSFCPLTRKRSLVHILVHRAMKICSPSALDAELAFLKEVFCKNGYPEHFVTSCIKRKLDSGLNSSLKWTAKDAPCMFGCPGRGNCLRKLVSRSGVPSHAVTFLASSPRVIFTTKALLPSATKDVLPALHLSNVIYKYTCRCETVYVGRTSQRLEDRAKQHVPPSITKPRSVSRQTYQRNCKQSGTTSCPTSSTVNVHGDSPGSAIHQHLLSNPSCLSGFTYDRFSILISARSAFQLSVLEALYIKQLKPELCRQKEFVYKLRLWSVRFCLLYYISVTKHFGLCLFVTFILWHRT